MIFDLLKLQFNSHFGAVKPEYSDYKKRLETFDDVMFWHPVIKGEEFASAGLFFRPTTALEHTAPDAVICFYCGKGLKNFAREADPLISHRRIHPLCLFVKVLT